jgi:thiamine kinase-like enzyme
LEDKVLDLIKTVNQDVSSVFVDFIERTGNNKAAIIHTEKALFFAKKYFNSNSDIKDRFQSEVSFFEYAKECAPDFVPKIYAIDEPNRIILFEKISGKNVKSEELDTNLILSAASFFSSLNKSEFKFTLGKKLNNAAEACFSINNHLSLVEKRILNLEKVIEDNLEIANASSTINLIRESFEKIKKHIFIFSNRNMIELDLEIEISRRVISPSDFGFHNCLKKENSDLIFFDFEYSGWDDPAKVIGDFFNQLQVPVSESYFDIFVEKAFENQKDTTELVSRAKLLLPLYKIKWACIALNIFIPVNLERRLFSNPNLDIINYKAEQIQKAKNILNNIQNNYYVIH